MSSDEENIQCPDCGAAVRPGASFCFKCGKHFGVGGAGADATEPVKSPDSAPVSTSVNTGELTETIPDMGIKAAEKEPAAAPVAVAEPEDTAKPVVIKPKPEMATAASMRRKPKPPREKIEMVWEQPESSTNPIFVAGTVVIFILVIVIIVMVYILK
jgi:hypothetical protein